MPTYLVLLVVHLRNQAIALKAPRRWILNLVQVTFGESQTAVIKHAVIRVEKTIGVVKAYIQLKTVKATKEMDSAQAIRLPKVPKLSELRPPSCHATIAEKRRKMVVKNPKALKKSQ